MDEYCRRCDPHGTSGSGGDATRGDSTIGGFGGDGINGGANGDGSTRGGDGIRGASGIINGGGTTAGGAATGVGTGDLGIEMANPPDPPEGLGLGMNTGDGDLLFCRRPLRRERSPSRNF
jgi:hypothetical protein